MAMRVEGKRSIMCKGKGEESFREINEESQGDSVATLWSSSFKQRKK